MKENLDIVLDDGWVRAGSCLLTGEPGAERAPRSDHYGVGKWICKLTGKVRQKTCRWVGCGGMGREVPKR